MLIAVEISAALIMSILLCLSRIRKGLLSLTNKASHRKIRNRYLRKITRTKWTYLIKTNSKWSNNLASVESIIIQAQITQEVFTASRITIRRARILLLGITIKHQDPAWANISKEIMKWRASLQKLKIAIEDSTPATPNSTTVASIPEWTISQTIKRTISHRTVNPNILTLLICLIRTQTAVK